MDFSRQLAFGPIDVVYTWVNGSDEKWRAERDIWMKKMEEKLAPSTNDKAGNTNTSSTQRRRLLWSDDDFMYHYGYRYSSRDSEYRDNIITKDSDLKPATSNDTTNSSSSGSTSIRAEDGENRFRDSNELKYSLRSVEKYAPWVRHIYLVTNGQIPKWLNLQASKLTIVTHNDIFLNKSHLPVFSSPAIEAHIHRIPGLSKKFIYFNDDVFLGAPVWPEDFSYTTGKQKVFLSWDVPPCASGCFDSYLGDGRCDKSCNVSACNFDYPDCVNATAYDDRYSYSGYTSSSKGSCAPGCQLSWLGDGYCDRNCNNADCAYDASDCGVGLIYKYLQGVQVWNMDATKAPDFSSLPRPQFVLKTGVTAVYANLTLHSPVWNMTKWEAWHDNSAILHEVILLKKFKLLLFVFQSTSKIVEKNIQLPQNATAVVSISSNKNYSTYFKVSVCMGNFQEDGDVLADSLGLPRNLVPLKYYHSSCHGYNTKFVFIPRPLTLKKLDRLDIVAGALVTDHWSSKKEQSFSFDVKLLSPENTTVKYSSHFVISQLVRFSNGSEISTSYFACPSTGLCNNTSVNVAVFLPDPYTVSFGWLTITLELKREVGCSSELAETNLNSTNQMLECVLACSNFLLRWGAKENLPPATSTHIATNSSGQTSTQEALLNQNRRLFDAGRYSLEGENYEQIYVQVRILDPSASTEIGSIGRHVRGNTPLEQMKKLLTQESEGTDFQYFWGKYSELFENWPGIADFKTRITLSFWENIIETLNFQRAFQHPSVLAGSNQRRNLLDTFAASLRHVSALLTNAFGKPEKSRKAIAHMPHMIDVDVMLEMQSYFQKEWEKTSMHRFRSFGDMQYAFAYFYFLMNRYHLHKDVVLWEWWTDSLDTNDDGHLDDNEILTLTAVVHGKGNVDSKAVSMKECLTKGKVEKPTFSDFKECESAVTAILKRGRRDPEYTIDDDTFIAFEMLEDDITALKNKLNWIREKRPKFFCLNDNMANPSYETQYQLWAFFESFFPKKSQFELEANYINKFRYIEDYRRLLGYLKLSWIVVLTLLIVSILYEYIRSYLNSGDEEEEEENRPHQD